MADGLCFSCYVFLGGCCKLAIPPLFPPPIISVLRTIPLIIAAHSVGRLEKVERDAKPEYLNSSGLYACSYEVGLNVHLYYHLCLIGNNY